MKLTKKQKLAIESLKKLTPQEISIKLEIPVVSVEDYLRNRGYITTQPGTDKRYSKGSPDLTGGLRQKVMAFWSANRNKILLIVVLGFIIYASALPNGFVSDDLPLLRSPNLKNPINTLINEPVSAFINSLTYTLNYYANGTNPLGYHLVNILFHILLTLFAYFFLSLLTKERIAFLASLIFLVVPLHTETVMWVSGRHYILYSIFVLLSLTLHLFASQPKAPLRYRLWSVIIFVFAVYSFPEQGLVLPFLLILVDFYQGKLLQRAKNYWPYFLLAAAFTFLSLSRVSQRIQEVNGSAAPLANTQINFVLADIVAISTYLQLFLIPLGLTFYHETVSTNSLEIIIRLLVLILLFGAPFYFIKKNRFFLLSVGIFIVALLPTITPFRVSWVVAERYAYLASLGLAMLTAYFINLAMERLKPNPTVKYLVTAIILVYSAVTFIRGFDWKDEDSLWVATAKTSPDSSKAQNNMGDYYGRHGDMQASFNAFIRATQINPTYSDAWHNAGNTLVQMGKYDESIPYFEKSLEFNPSLIEAYNNLALVYHKKGDGQKASDMINKSLQINPYAAKTYSMWAFIEYENKNIDKAKEALKKGLEVDPRNQALLQNLQILENQQTRP